MNENPFDNLEIDPLLSARELTEKLRQRAELAKAEDREKIQKLWRQLTLNEKDRLKFSLLAHPRPGGAEAGAIEKLKRKVPPMLIRFPKQSFVAKHSDLFTTPHFAYESPTPPKIK